MQLTAKMVIPNRIRALVILILLAWLLSYLGKMQGLFAKIKEKIKKLGMLHTQLEKTP